LATKQDKPAATRSTTKTTTKTTKPRTRRRKAPTRDAIAERAYELYLRQAEGDDVSHWLQAERELAAV
jgi:Protein of unknown function (DUF2934)